MQDKVVSKISEEILKAKDRTELQQIRRKLVEAGFKRTTIDSTISRLKKKGILLPYEFGVLDFGKGLKFSITSERRGIRIELGGDEEKVLPFREILCRVIAATLELCGLERK